MCSIFLRLLKQPLHFFRCMTFLKHNTRKHKHIPFLTVWYLNCNIWQPHLTLELRKFCPVWFSSKDMITNSSQHPEKYLFFFQNWISFSVFVLFDYQATAKIIQEVYLLKLHIQNQLHSSMDLSMLWRCTLLCWYNTWSHDTLEAHGWTVQVYI